MGSIASLRTALPEELISLAKFSAVSYETEVAALIARLASSWYLVLWNDEYHNYDDPVFSSRTPYSWTGKELKSDNCLVLMNESLSRMR